MLVDYRTTVAIRYAPHSLRSLRCSGFVTFFLRLPSAYSAQKKRRIAANVVRNAWKTRIILLRYMCEEKEEKTCPSWLLAVHSSQKMGGNAK